MFGQDNKQPFQAQSMPAFGMMGGYNGFSPYGFSPYGSSPYGGGQGLPSGYAAPPKGVPFQQNPYLPFGSGFGLGLPFWSSGFGRGPGFPSENWTPPSAAQSPQSPVTPPGGAGGAGGDFTALDLMRFDQQGILPGGQRIPFGSFSSAPEGFQQQFQSVYGRNAIPQFAQNQRQQRLDMMG